MAEKNRIRSNQIRVHLTDEELQYAKDKAASCNKNMSDYIRGIIRDGCIIKYEPYDIKELSKALNRIGTNINQIAKHINERGGEYDRKDIEELEKCFREIQAEAYGRIWNITERD